jgi:hypothetical protein
MMVGVTSIEVKESLDELTKRLSQAKRPSNKERLQVLYWLKQENAPSISLIAKAIGKHRNTLPTWLSMYRKGGIEGMLATKTSSGGVRVIPQWAENALGKKLLEESNGFQALWTSATMVSPNTGDKRRVSCSLPDDSLSTQSQTKGCSSSKLQARQREAISF